MKIFNKIWLISVILFLSTFAQGSVLIYREQGEWGEDEKPKVLRTVKEVYEKYLDINSTDNNDIIEILRQKGIEKTHVKFIPEDLWNLYILHQNMTSLFYPSSLKEEHYLLFAQDLGKSIDRRHAKNPSKTRLAIYSSLALQFLEQIIDNHRVGQQGLSHPDWELILTDLKGEYESGAVLTKNIIVAQMKCIEKNQYCLFRATKGVEVRFDNEVKLVLDFPLLSKDRKSTIIDLNVLKDHAFQESFLALEFKNLSYTPSFLAGEVYDGPSRGERTPACLLAFFGKTRREDCPNPIVYSLCFKKNELKQYLNLFYLGKTPVLRNVYSVGENWHPRIRTLYGSYEITQVNRVMAVHAQACEEEFLNFSDSDFQHLKVRKSSFEDLKHRISFMMGGLLTINYFLSQNVQIISSETHKETLLLNNQRQVHDYLEKIFLPRL